MTLVKTRLSTADTYSGSRRELLMTESTIDGVNV